MKELKLEVGKTYINRKGEEVKIVWSDSTTKYPCRGDDWEWYAENGRFDLDVEESECDLIEEVPSETICHTFVTPEEAKKVTATRYTFAIPDGVKELTVEQEGNRIVVEMVPEKAPKPGDVMINEHDSVYIFKEVINPNSHSQYAWLGKTGNLLIDYGRCSPGRPATPEEAKPLWDALKKAGKRWNPETMQVEEIPESDRILEWVETRAVEGDYNHEQLCWLIDEYLKHKEGEK